MSSVSQRLTDSQMAQLAASFGRLERIQIAHYERLKATIGVLPVSELVKLADSDIRFINTAANSVLVDRNLRPASARLDHAPWITVKDGDNGYYVYMDDEARCTVAYVYGENSVVGECDPAQAEQDARLIAAELYAALRAVIASVDRAEHPDAPISAPAWAAARAALAKATATAPTPETSR